MSTMASAFAFDGHIVHLYQILAPEISYRPPGALFWSSGPLRQTCWERRRLPYSDKAFSDHRMIEL